jgi:hypothetical protein
MSGAHGSCGSSPRWSLRGAGARRPRR